MVEVRRYPYDEIYVYSLIQQHDMLAKHLVTN